MCIFICIYLCSVKCRANLVTTVNILVASRRAGSGKGNWVSQGWLCEDEEYGSSGCEVKNTGLLLGPINILVASRRAGSGKGNWVSQGWLCEDEEYGSSGCEVKNTGLLLGPTKADWGQTWLSLSLEDMFLSVACHEKTPVLALGDLNHHVHDTPFAFHSAFAGVLLPAVMTTQKNMSSSFCQVSYHHGWLCSKTTAPKCAPARAPCGPKLSSIAQNGMKFLLLFLKRAPPKS